MNCLIGLSFVEGVRYGNRWLSHDHISRLWSVTKKDMPADVCRSIYGCSVFCSYAAYFVHKSGLEAAKKSVSNE